MTSVIKSLFVSSLILFLVLLSRNQAEAKNWNNSRNGDNNSGLFPQLSSRSEHHQHLRNLQSSRFSLRRKFCIPDGTESFETKNVFFFRSFLFRRRYGQDNEGPCGEEKCSELCEHIPCMISYAFSQDTGSCICNGDSTPVECGVNAECSKTSDACVCKEGYTGDALTGCAAETPVPTSTHGGKATTTPVNAMTSEAKTTAVTESPSFATTTMPVTAKLTTKSPTSRITSTSKPKSIAAATFPSTSAPSGKTPCGEESKGDEKCCDGKCMKCCPGTDGRQCDDGTCANHLPNFGGCCTESICGDNCCAEGFKCCDGECKLPTCCNNPDPCCGADKGCSSPASGGGDPHLTTFDGLAYDCQAEGDFVLSKSLNSSFEIQTRFKRVETFSASIMKGFAIKPSDGSSPIVQVLVDEGDHSTVRLWANGEEIRNAPQEYKKGTTEFGTLSNDNSHFDYFFQSSDALINVTIIDTMKGKFLNLNLKLRNQILKETIVGLLGSPDDDPDNDWMNGNGDIIEVPSTGTNLTSTIATDYCKQNWCLQERQNSIFVYSNDAEFETLSNGCTQSYPGRPKCTDPQILELCGTDPDCILDGHIFDIDTARSSVASQVRYLESTSRFLVSPSNLAAGIDKVINVTLDLRNKKDLFEFEHIDFFDLYTIHERASELMLSNRTAILKRSSDRGVYNGENIDISDIALSAGDFLGFKAVPANLTASATTTSRKAFSVNLTAGATITSRKAFRVLNKLGEGKCFQTKAELQLAVNEYLSDSSRGTAVARQYGWPIGIWCVKLIKDFGGMFKYAYDFTESLHLWDVSQATSMESMFEEAWKFSSDISQWNVENVVNMMSMFRGARSFSSDISTWDVSHVTRMDMMFREASSFSSDLLTWNVSQVKNMSSMFAEATSFSSDLSTWDVSKVTNMWAMFHSARSFSSDIAAWSVSHVTTMSYMFYHASIFSSDISAWDVSKVENMIRMFDGASNFSSDLSNWRVDSVTSMWGMFLGASKFQSNISAWNVSQVTTIEYMFNGASSFQQNLCPWGSLLQSSHSGSKVFIGTSCPITDDPDFSLVVPGPFCHDCSST